MCAVVLVAMMVEAVLVVLVYIRVCVSVCDGVVVCGDGVVYVWWWCSVMVWCVWWCSVYVCVFVYAVAMAMVVVWCVCVCVCVMV